MRIKRGKPSDVTLDIPLLHRKGLVKLEPLPALPGNAKYSEGYADYSDALAPVPSIPASLPNASPPSNPFDLLSSLANAGSPSSTIPGMPYDSPSEGHSPQELQHLKVKLEDLEYKLDRLIDRLALIESKID